MTFYALSSNCLWLYKPVRVDLVIGFDFRKVKGKRKCFLRNENELILNVKLRLPSHIPFILLGLMIFCQQLNYFSNFTCCTFGFLFTFHLKEQKPRKFFDITNALHLLWSSICRFFSKHFRFFLSCLVLESFRIYISNNWKYGFCVFKNFRKQSSTAPSIKILCNIVFRKNWLSSPPHGGWEEGRELSGTHYRHQFRWLAQWPTWLKEIVNLFC